jgi:hypothetical protein
MAALLFYDPSGARFGPIQPDEFAQLLADLRANSKVSKLVISGETGSCEVQGVDFAWTYDGVISLHVAITAKHGFVTSHVPNETIFDELNRQFIQVATQSKT